MARKFQKIRKMAVMEEYTPLPHQVAFHTSPDKYRAMVSGVGGGKTLMGAKEIIKWCQLYPGSLHVIGRLTSKSLKETTQKRFFEICPNDLIEDFNDTDSHLWMRTNERDRGAPVYSEILFMHLDDPGPLGSLDISSFWIDEAHEAGGGEVPEDTFQMLMARLRHEVGPHRGFVTTNSGGKDWVYRRFFDPKKLLQDKLEMERFLRGEIPHKPASFWGMIVPTKANPYLPPGYEAELRRNNPETWVKRFLDASFDVFEGQIFPEFTDDVKEYDRDVLDRHVYKNGEVDLPPTWRYERGFDFGVSAPTAVIYGSVAEIDGKEHLFIYDEYYRREAEIKDCSNDIKKRGFEYVFADPACQYRGADKKSPADLYLAEGVSLLPSTNDEHTFFAQLHTLLRENRIHIDVEKCPNLIDEIKASAWDKSTIVGSGVKEKARKDLKHPDHARDALKYLILGLGMFNTAGKLDPVVASSKVVREDTNLHPSEIEDEDNDLYSDVLKGGENL